jgi:RNA polymerase sigma factor (sigma-70 family)
MELPILYTNMTLSNPLLSKEEEYLCFKSYINNNDKKAFDKIITCNLRFVFHFCKKYQHNNIPFDDIIQEGIIGIIKAAKIFDPDKNVRFISYAVFHIKEHVIKYVTRHQNIIHTLTTKNLYRLYYSKGDTSDIRLKDIQLYQDIKNISYVDVYESNILGPSILDELLTAERAEYNDSIYEKINLLTEREKDIIISRNLLESKVSLVELAKKYNVSYERIRQIENIAKNKLTKLM